MYREIAMYLGAGGLGALLAWLLLRPRSPAKAVPSTSAPPARVPAPASQPVAEAILPPAPVFTAPAQPVVGQLAVYLRPTDPSFDWATQRVLGLLATRDAVPTFSAAAMKLSALTHNTHVTLEEMASVIALDPGLTARCLKATASVTYGGHAAATLPEALLRLGQREIRRVAVSASVMKGFTHLAREVEWHAFWLHSILVARLTERLASAFQEPSGLEYLAGLLHDAGKLFIQQHFPEYFPQVLREARARNCGHALVERDLLGLDHAQIGAAIGLQLNLHPQVVSAICYHHNPRDETHIADPDGDHGFLAACVFIADHLAHRVSTSLGGEADLTCTFEELPEWLNLSRFPRVRSLELDPRVELELAEADLKLFFPG